MAALARPEPGWVIDGRYALEERIGEGGMATVWKATHQRLQQPVAVKFLRRSDDRGLRERFLREAQVAAAIRHRHVVDVLDVGVEQGWVYMVMELLDGNTLHQVLKRDGTLELPSAVRVAAQVLGGLTAVHDSGMIHRDVKPDNIVLVEDADGIYPKLLDFGVSKSALSGQSGERKLHSVIPTEENMIVGTPEYMSPEQIRSDSELTPAADVYSMGVLMYEMLSGERPFNSEGMSAAALMIRAATQTPRPLSDFRPDLPKPVLEFVEKCMARTPEERFPNARAMRRGLIVAVSKTAQQIEDSNPEAAQELGRSISAAYEPGDSAVIYVGTVGSGEFPKSPPSSPTLDDIPELPPHKAKPWGWWIVAGFVALGLIMGVGLGLQDDEEPSETTADTMTPAEPSAVTFTLRGLVPDAVVTVDGRAVVGPRLELPRDGEAHLVEVTAPGYEPWEARRRADDDQLVDVTLERIVDPPPPVAMDPEPVTPMVRTTMRNVSTRPTMTSPVMAPESMASMGGMGSMRFRDPGF